MQQPRQEPEKGRCVCGRRLRDAAVHTYRSHTDRFVFHRCECGSEWTVHLTDVDPAAPVSSDEVIEVHNQLAKFDGSIAELISKQAE